MLNRLNQLKITNYFLFIIIKLWFSFSNINDFRCCFSFFLFFGIRSKCVCHTFNLNKKICYLDNDLLYECGRVNIPTLDNFWHWLLMDTYFETRKIISYRNVVKKPVMGFKRLFSRLNKFKISSRAPSNLIRLWSNKKWLVLYLVRKSYFIFRVQWSCIHLFVNL